jgi:hypothetical protein
MLAYRQDGEKERQKMPRAKSAGAQQENKQESQQGAAKAPEFAKLDSYEVVEAREYSKDGKTWHNATVRINGVTIYGCRAVTYVDHHDGNKEKDFLSFPQREGKDSAGNKKWYHHCFIALSPEDQQKICDAIWAKLDGKA